MVTRPVLRAAGKLTGGSEGGPDRTDSSVLILSSSLAGSVGFRLHSLGACRSRLPPLRPAAGGAVTQSRAALASQQWLCPTRIGLLLSPKGAAAPSSSAAQLRTARAAQVRAACVSNCLQGCRGASAAGDPRLTCPAGHRRLPPLPLPLLTGACKLLLNPCWLPTRSPSCSKKSTCTNPAMGKGGARTRSAASAASGGGSGSGGDDPFQVGFAISVWQNSGDQSKEASNWGIFERQRTWLGQPTIWHGEKCGESCDFWNRWVPCAVVSGGQTRVCRMGYFATAPQRALHTAHE